MNSQLWVVRDVVNGDRHGQTVLLYGRPFMDCVTYAHNFARGITGEDTDEDNRYLTDTDMPILYIRSFMPGKTVILAVEQVQTWHKTF